MSAFADLKMYWRFLWGLRRFLRQSISLDDARATIRRQLAEREAAFLCLVERGIFGYSRSPYLPLLKLAGCEMGDLRNMVRARGLEATLGALRDAGVYVTFEEFKGREPMVRGGRVFPVSAKDFDNPYLTRHYQAQTGGSTGAGTRVDIDLDHWSAGLPRYKLVYDAYGILNTPTAIWRGILPDGTGINNALIMAALRCDHRKWFTPVTSKDLRSSFRYWLATEYTIAMARACGVRVPRPEPVSLDQAAIIARWAAETLRSDGACVIRSSISLAVRVALAAQAEGLDLSGATFMGGGEPPTTAKVQNILSTGARYFAVYALTEIGHVGLGCLHPIDVNDNHYLKDAVAIIQTPRQVPGFDITVPAFNFTTLMPTAPKIMLNVESDDYGIIETRACGCPLEALGYTEHVRGIYSFRKLTGEGATLIGSEMIRILEEVLPARFGGSPLDYQLMEEETEKGLTQLTLVISPNVSVADEAEVIEVVLTALKQSSRAAELAQALWRQAQTLRIKRREPVWTARGKLLPLHLAHKLEQAEEGPGS
jgi:hypothetical protein